MEWTPDMKTAYETLVYLNDKYELDGRDPNGSALTHQQTYRRT